MFEKSRSEKLRSALIRFGKKNFICSILAMIAMGITGFFISLGKLVGSNAKHLSLGIGSLLLSVVFSSFSFPAFIGRTQVTGSIDFGEMDETISLVTEITSENLALEEDMAASAEDSDQYEILDAAEVESFDADAILSAAKKDHAAELTETVGDPDIPAAEDLLETDSHDLDENTSLTDSLQIVCNYDDYVFDSKDWRLILVNKQHSIPDDYEITLGTVAGSLQCDERILEPLLDMLEAAKNDGVTLTVCSPYRTAEHQVELFDNKLKKYLNMGYSYVEAYQKAGTASAIPGTSEHELGLALDIVCPSYTTLNAGFGNTDAGIWLAAHAYEYGFILRYPYEKDYITGIIYEPWHFRYVGEEAATYITAHDLTLEEFWEEKF